MTGGDGTNSGWLGPYGSGETVCADHSWDMNGTYEIRVKAKDEDGLESPWSDPLVVLIGGVEDDTPPHVEVTKPENGVYYYNSKAASLPFMSVIIGYIDIEVTAYDADSGLNRVEFYINGMLKSTDTSEPYVWTWDESPKRGFHTITVVAYDNAGNSESDEVMVWRVM